MLAISILTTLVGLALIRGRVRRIRVHRDRVSLLKRAVPLGSDTPVGTLIKLSGRIGFPEFVTPHFAKDAGYYRLVLRGKFERKRKKPASGMQTHRPVLHASASDHQPLLLRANTGHTVHVCLPKPWAQYLDLIEAKQELYQLPAKLAEFGDPKHESYELTESYYPAQQRLFAVGTLVEKNRAGVVLGGDDLGSDDHLLSTRLESELWNEARASLRNQYSYIALILCACAGVWSIYAS